MINRTRTINKSLWPRITVKYMILLVLHN